MKTTSERIEIDVNGASMPAYVAKPEGEGKWPGVLLFMEVFGVNRHIRSVADRLAAEGYVVLALDIFHRTAPGIELGYTDGESVAIDSRYAEDQPSRLPALAAELIRLGVDVIVTERRHVIGVMGIEAKAVDFTMSDDEHDRLEMYIRRAAQTLDDMLLQGEVFAALEGLHPQISISRLRAEDVEYLPGRQKHPSVPLPDREETIEQVRAALRHYWGGPGITRSRLLDFTIVQQALEGSGPGHRCTTAGRRCERQGRSEQSKRDDEQAQTEGDPLQRLHIQSPEALR